MKKIVCPMIMLSILFPATVFAKIDDVAQKKDWFYLQTLSKQTEKTFRCIITLELNEQDALWKTSFSKYYQQTEELSKEVELYILKYKDDTNPANKENVLRYRVWDVVMNVKADVGFPTKDDCLTHLTL